MMCCYVVTRYWKALVGPAETRYGGPSGDRFEPDLVVKQVEYMTTHSREDVRNVSAQIT